MTPTEKQFVVLIGFEFAPSAVSTLRLTTKRVTIQTTLRKLPSRRTAPMLAFRRIKVSIIHSMRNLFPIISAARHYRLAQLLRGVQYLFLLAVLLDLFRNGMTK
jgi:hypothetical protein